MTERRAAIGRDERAAPEQPSSSRLRHTNSSGLAERRTQRPHSREDAEERYVAARDTWTAAMRASRSGKPADLAALAIAQEAYEAALHEKQRWDASPRVAIPIEADRPRGIDVVVGQEISWRRVHEHEQDERPTGLRGLLDRLRGR